MLDLLLMEIVWTVNTVEEFTFSDFSLRWKLGEDSCLFSGLWARLPFLAAGRTETNTPWLDNPAFCYSITGAICWRKLRMTLSPGLTYLHTEWSGLYNLTMMEEYWNLYLKINLNLNPFSGRVLFLSYSTALLSAVERSVHLHGPSRLPVVNYVSILTVAMHIMTAVKRKVTSLISLRK